MLKTLVDCKPSEFMRQTYRIKKYAKEWLDLTGIMEIRRRRPKLETAPESASAEDRAAVIKKNAELEKAQAQANLSAIFDEVFGSYPDQTLNLLALCCFVEPEDVDNHTVQDYLEAASRMMGDQAVLGFFISWARLARTNTKKA